MTELQWLTYDRDEGWSAYADLHSRHMQELIPGDRPTPVALLREGIRHLAADTKVSQVLVMVGGEAVGAAAFAVDGLRPDSAGMWFLYVAPEHRRQGFGTRLLNEARRVASDEGRTSHLRAASPAGDPAGRGFALRAGGRAGLVIEVNRCPTAGLDEVQLRSWRERAAERAAGYSLVALTASALTNTSRRLRP